MSDNNDVTSENPIDIDKYVSIKSVTYCLPIQHKFPQLPKKYENVCRLVSMIGQDKIKRWNEKVL